MDRGQPTRSARLGFGLEGPGHRVASHDPRVYRGPGAPGTLAGRRHPVARRRSCRSELLRCQRQPCPEPVAGAPGRRLLPGPDRLGGARQSAHRPVHQPRHRHPGCLGGAGHQVRPIRLRPVHDRARPSPGLRAATPHRVRAGPAHPRLPGPGDPTRRPLRDHRRLGRPELGVHPGHPRGVHREPGHARHAPGHDHRDVPPGLRLRADGLGWGRPHLW